MARGGRIIALVLAIAALLALSRVLPLDTWLVALVEWVRAAGVVGVAVFVSVYALGTVVLVPGSVLTLGAGYLYGPFLGTAVVSLASVTGATLAFLVARSRVLDWISTRIAQHQRFSAVSQAVGDEGFKVVVLLRLTPFLPFVALNYALGLTRVSLGSYVLASFLGMLPWTFVYVYLGSLITEVTALAAGAPREQSGSRQLLLWGGLAATVVVTVLVTRIARRALAARLESDGPPAP